MKKLAALAALLVILPPLARSQESLVRFQPEPDFEAVVGAEIFARQPKDAFAGVADCSIVDAKTIRAYTLPEAAAALAPCLKGVSARYGAALAAKAGAVAPARSGRGAVLGLVIRTPAVLAAGGPALSDLNRALALRGGRLLGFPAVIRREGERDPGARSAAQDAVDRCIQPMIVRRIASAEDFIRFYGRCIREDRSLKVKELRPSPAGALSVSAVSEADGVTIQSLNGTVAVNPGGGPVEVLVLAYPETAALP